MKSKLKTKDQILGNYFKSSSEILADFASFLEDVFLCSSSVSLKNIKISKFENECFDFWRLVIILINNLPLTVLIVMLDFLINIFTFIHNIYVYVFLFLCLFLRSSSRSSSAEGLLCFSLLRRERTRSWSSGYLKSLLMGLLCALHPKTSLSDLKRCFLSLAM